MVPCYRWGTEIRIGDRILYAGRPGRVVFVIDTASYSADFPEDDWSYLGCGYMIDVPPWGLIHCETTVEEEDLEFVAREESAT